MKYSRQKKAFLVSYGSWPCIWKILKVVERKYTKQLFFASIDKTTYLTPLLKNYA
jgi:hypothetical protein